MTDILIALAIILGTVALAYLVTWATDAVYTYWKDRRAR